MKKLFCTFAILATATVFAINGEDINADLKKPNPEQEVKNMKKFGGFVTQPGSQSGSIGFLNAQTKFGKGDFEMIISSLRKMLKHEMKVVEGVAIAGLPTKMDVERHGVSLAVFVVDDTSLPVVLAAPEDRWALVNVAKIGEGLPDNVAGKGLARRRFRAEVKRAFALLCGGWSSQYKGNMFSATSLKELDAVDADALIVDVIMRCESYLKSMGINPARSTTYHRAYLEGWAPDPINEYQQAVIDKIEEGRMAKGLPPLKKHNIK